MDPQRYFHLAPVWCIRSDKAGSNRPPASLSPWQQWKTIHDLLPWSHVSPQLIWPKPQSLMEESNYNLPLAVKISVLDNRALELLHSHCMALLQTAAWQSTRIGTRKHSRRKSVYPPRRSTSQSSFVPLTCLAKYGVRYCQHRGAARQVASHNARARWFNAEVWPNVLSSLLSI